MTWTNRSLALLLGALIAAACRPVPRAHPVGAAVVLPPSAVERGAVTYAAYCAGCHGAKGNGRGDFARFLGFEAADLRAPALRTLSDEALVDRIMQGAPLTLRPGASTLPNELDVDALAAYLPLLGATDRELLRVGRLVFEDACAPCHGAYGRSEGAIAHWLGITDLLTTRERHSDAGLARISRAGIGNMPALVPDAFDPGEVRALIAYVRHLSDGFRLYDTYCAACHGDDGQGIYSQDLPPPAGRAPPLRAPFPPQQILHMLQRERGLMPHFRDLVGAARIRDVIAYLRSGRF